MDSYSFRLCTRMRYCYCDYYHYGLETNGNGATDVPCSYVTPYRFCARAAFARRRSNILFERDARLSISPRETSSVDFYMALYTMPKTYTIVLTCCYGPFSTSCPRTNVNSRFLNGDMYLFIVFFLHTIEHRRSPDLC